ncbi:MAG: Flp pilus assembly complex ATPase component TadA [Candidatus Competibacteraceae bacterium]|nr:Flp pilus assembly complex ATPase component TadA [Candidatus Competibacteraceae bacterium]
MRQAPNVVPIGEVRDRETMQQALNFAETNLSVLTTLRQSSDQAFDRIVNFFPEEKRAQVLIDCRSTSEPLSRNGCCRVRISLR